MPAIASGIDVAVAGVCINLLFANSIDVASISGEFRVQELGGHGTLLQCRASSGCRSSETLALDAGQC